MNAALGTNEASGAIPMRWPFRVIAGILAFLVFGPFMISLIYAEPKNILTITMMACCTWMFASLAITGKNWPLQA